MSKPEVRRASGISSGVGLKAARAASGMFARSHDTSVRIINFIRNHLKISSVIYLSSSIEMACSKEMA